jgi:hypothetical protein
VSDNFVEVKSQTGDKMRIYKIMIEHSRFGLKFSSVSLAAKSCEEAIKKANKKMRKNERVESVELLASED